jgi:hypothetical protein
MAYYDYLVLVGAPACVYSQYVHMCFIIFEGEKKCDIWSFQEFHCEILCSQSAPLNTVLI